MDSELNPRCCIGRMGLICKSQRRHARPIGRSGASVAQIPCIRGAIVNSRAARALPVGERAALTRHQDLKTTGRT